MDRYIGLDAHASSCTLGVLGPSGKRLGLHVVETNAKALIVVLRSIPGPRHLCLEEGTLAGWLYEVLSPHVEEIVVTAVSGLFFRTSEARGIGLCPASSRAPVAGAQG